MDPALAIEVAASSNLKAMDDITALGNSPVQKFYNNSVVFLTGGSGFLGKQLVEKLIRMIKDWPNTYTFTKSISEELVRTTSTGLPICIVRPAITLCTYCEPSPGWLDLSCVYGASGLVLGSMLGVLHVVRVKSEVKLGVVPCDYVNNAIIAAARETARNQAKGGTNTKILYTVSSTQRNPITWGYLEETARTKGVNILPPSAVYYQYGYSVASSGLFLILTLFLHLVPAYIADIVCVIIGKQRRFVKTAKKVYNMCNALSFFLMNEWQLIDYNLDKLYNNLSNHDKIIFNFDITDIDWTEYFLIWATGVRKYIIKDGLKDTAYGIKKQRYLRVAHYLITMLYIYGVWKLICLLFHIVI